jgi:hypothetical protein
MSLTEEQIVSMWDQLRSYHGAEPCKLGHLEFARAIEAHYEDQTKTLAAQSLRTIGLLGRQVVTLKAALSAQSNRNEILEEVARVIESDTFSWGGREQERANAGYFAGLVREMKQAETVE